MRSFLCCLQRPPMSKPCAASSFETLRAVVGVTQRTSLCGSAVLGSLLSTKDKAMGDYKCNSTHNIKRNQRKANLESQVQRSVPKVNRSLLIQRGSQDSPFRKLSQSTPSSYQTDVPAQAWRARHSLSRLWNSAPF